MPSPLPQGATLFFPNIIFRLVRSTLPPHQAVFRVPPYITKIDVKSLLGSLYGIDVLDVRTMNYLGRMRKDRRGRPVAGAAFKKVIITMKDDFEFPAPVSPSRDDAMVMPPRMLTRAPTIKFRHLLPEPEKEKKSEGNP